MLFPFHALTPGRGESWFTRVLSWYRPLVKWHTRQDAFRIPERIVNLRFGPALEIGKTLLPNMFTISPFRMSNPSSKFWKKVGVFQFQVIVGVLSITPAEALKFDPVMMMNSRPDLSGSCVGISHDVYPLSIRKCPRCPRSMTRASSSKTRSHRCLGVTCGKSRMDIQTYPCSVALSIYWSSFTEQGFQWTKSIENSLRLDDGNETCTETAESTSWDVFCFIGSSFSWYHGIRHHVTTCCVISSCLPVPASWNREDNSPIAGVTRHDSLANLRFCGALPNRIGCHRKVDCKTLCHEQWIAMASSCFAPRDVLSLLTPHYPPPVANMQNHKVYQSTVCLASCLHFISWSC